MAKKTQSKTVELTDEQAKHRDVVQAAAKAENDAAEKAASLRKKPEAVAVRTEISEKE